MEKAAKAAKAAKVAAAEEAARGVVAVASGSRRSPRPSATTVARLGTTPAIALKNRKLTVTSYNATLHLMNDLFSHSLS